MSVEQPLPDEWLKDLEEDIPIKVEEDKLKALGFMKAEQNENYEKWIGGNYELDYHAGAQEIMGYREIDI